MLCNLTTGLWPLFWMVVVLCATYTYNNQSRP